jgi:hypothetical protein
VARWGVPRVVLVLVFGQLALVFGHHEHPRAVRIGLQGTDATVRATEIAGLLGLALWANAIGGIETGA